MKNLSIESISVALFFTTELHKPHNIFNDFKDSLPFLDGIKIELPDVAEIPAEVPRLIFKSLNEETFCQISKTRIDFSLNSVNSIDDINSRITTFIKYILEKQNVNRFGLVGTFFYQSENSLNELKTKYFNNSLSEINELSIRFNKPFKHNTLCINDVVSIEAGVNKDSTDSKGNLITTQGTLIIRDLNNLIDEKNHLNLENLLDLYNKVSPQLQLQAIESLI